MTLWIFSACASPSAPPKTVKSWLKTQTRRPSIGPEPGHDPVGVRPGTLEAHAVRPVANEQVELFEGALVEQVVDPLAGGHLALGLVGLDRALASRRSSPRPASPRARPAGHPSSGRATGCSAIPGRLPGGGVAVTHRERAGDRETIRSRALYAAGVSDDDLVRRLRAGDELAFSELINAYHSSMVRLAQTFVSSRAVAEEVAQDTWVAVLEGASDGFEGRSSLKTWIFHILANRARSTGAREQRIDTGGPRATKAAWTAGGSTRPAPGRRRRPTGPTRSIERLSSGEFLARVQGALLQLPESQRAVVTLRDLDGLSSKEVCDVLEISEANQRVLLHRGRSRIRAIFEDEVAKR